MEDDREFGETAVREGQISRADLRAAVDARPRHSTEWGKDAQAQLLTSQPWRHRRAGNAPGNVPELRQGEIADVRIYKRALDPEEMDVVFKAGSSARKKN